MLSGEQPSITKVSRQLRRETLKLFYSLNDFEINLYSFEIADFEPNGKARALVKAWLGSIGKETAGAIRAICIYYHFRMLESTDTQQAIVDNMKAEPELRQVASVTKWSIELRTW